jgi:hypothetical protein
MDNIKMTLARTILNRLNETDIKQDFDDALQKLLDKLNEFIEIKNAKSIKEFPNGYYDKYKAVEVKKGKYVKIYSTIKQLGEKGRNAYCFVDKSNGNIYKAASWLEPYIGKNPVKTARGNIYDKTLYANIDFYDLWLDNKTSRPRIVIT